MNNKRIDEIRSNKDEKQIQMIKERLKAAWTNDQSHTQRLGNN